MSQDYYQKVQYHPQQIPQNQHQQQQQQQEPQNYIYENNVDCISYYNNNNNINNNNEEEEALNYNKYSINQNTYKYSMNNYTSATSHNNNNNNLKEESLQFIPQESHYNMSSTQQHENTFLSYPSNSQHQNHLNQQIIPTAASTQQQQQQFASPFSLNLTETSKQLSNSVQNAPIHADAYSSSQNYVFSNPSNNQLNMNNNNSKQFVHYSQNDQTSSVQFVSNINNRKQMNELNQNQYPYEQANQDNIFLPYHYQQESTAVSSQPQQYKMSSPSTTYSTSTNTPNNNGQYYQQQYMNVQETFPSIQTLNDIDTAFSSSNDLQMCPQTQSNQQASPFHLQQNQLLKTHSNPASHFYSDNNISYKQTETYIFDCQNALEAKNEEQISSNHSLCEKQSKFSKDTNPIIIACNSSKRKGSDSDSDATKSSTTLNFNKQQSQLKNANKFCMVSLLNFLTDILPNTKEYHHLIKYIIRIKGSGKMRQKVDIFTLAHFRVLFLTINDWNITQLNANDIKMHKIIFSEINKSTNWTKEDHDYMNSIKQQLLYLSIQFFEDSSYIKQKIQSKSWQNEDTAQHYIEWVNRISKGIKKMSSGVYIHRF